MAVNLHAYAREQLHDLFVCCLLSATHPALLKSSVGVTLAASSNCMSEMTRRSGMSCCSRRSFLTNSAIFCMALYEVCAQAPVGPLKTLHLLHKCRLLAKIMPLWIRRKGENPIAEDRVRDLRGEDAKCNCRFHGSSRNAGRDVDHSDHTRETNWFPSAR